MMATNAPHMTPESLWALGIFAALFIFSFAACAVAIFRNTERGSWSNPSTDRIAPIPMAKGFDARLTPSDRIREVQWLEAMMEAPARKSAGRKSGPSDGAGDLGEAS